MNLLNRLKTLRERLTLPPQLIEFKEQTIIIAKTQPQYRPLPAYKYRQDPEGKTVFCWNLSWRDRLRVLMGRPIWHTVLTFNDRLQPQMLDTDKPPMPFPWPGAVRCPHCSERTIMCDCGAVIPIDLAERDIVHEHRQIHQGTCMSCSMKVNAYCPANLRV